MATKAKPVLPGDELPSGFTLMPDGSWVEKKIVQANSRTFGEDLEAAFRWNVRRILAERRDRD